MQNGGFFDRATPLLDVFANLLGKDLIIEAFHAGASDFETVALKFSRAF